MENNEFMAHMDNAITNAVGATFAYLMMRIDHGDSMVTVSTAEMVDEVLDNIVSDVAKARLKQKLAVAYGQ